MSADLRPLDHLVLPVGDLAVAEARYAALGFTVAPRGKHPFGTVNACVYFSDDTFLEALAIGDAARAAEAVKAGNVFVGHDAKYRTRVGPEGLSALVLGTNDAVADHARFEADGISGGNMLRFSRPFNGEGGASSEATFLLAFASDIRAPDALFFTCERVGVPNVDRTPLTRHSNGVLRMKRVVMVAPEPQLFETLLSKLLDDADATRIGDGFDVVTATSTISVRDPRSAADLLGGRPWDTYDPTPQFAAIEFETVDLSQTEGALQASGIAFDRIGGSMRVASAAGQGVPFIFSGASA